MKKYSDLKELRNVIEIIDTNLVVLLLKREKISLKIGREKIRQGKPVVDIALENERIARAKMMSKNLGAGYFSQRFVEKVLHKIIVHCRKQQEALELRAKRKTKK